MNNGNVVGPDGIPIEVWKCVGEQGIIWLIKLFNGILRSKKMLDEWRSTLWFLYLRTNKIFIIVLIIEVYNL